MVISDIKEQMVIKSIRMPASLDNDLSAIAKYEDRTVSKIIQRFLKRAVRQYEEEHPNWEGDLELMYDMEEKRKNYKKL